MAKNVARLRALVFSAAFAAFSGAVAFGWLYGVDLWVLWAAQDHSSGLLDAAASVFSLPGRAEIAGLVLLALLVRLILRGRRTLAGRLLVTFVAMGLVELAMKLYLPQAPVPEEAGRAADYAPLFAIDLPHPYPSGHVIRGVIVLGALRLLSKTRLLRAVITFALVGLMTSRIYLGTHWAPDVVGGALLGVTAVLWAFGKEDREWRSR